MELKGSKTEANLMAAFAGESQAHTKYEYYASQAKKDGYEQIAAIFEETSKNEKEHAKLWFKYLHGGSIPDTVTNLKDAASGEKTLAGSCRQFRFSSLLQKNDRGNNTWKTSLHPEIYGRISQSFRCPTCSPISCRPYTGWRTCSSSGSLKGFPAPRRCRWDPRSCTC